MDELKLAYLAGVKVGIESLVEGLKITAGKNGNQLPIEFVKVVAESTITDVELKITSIENRKGLLDVLDNKQIGGTYYGICKYGKRIWHRISKTK